MAASTPPSHCPTSAGAQRARPTRPGGAAADELLDHRVGLVLHEHVDDAVWHLHVGRADLEHLTRHQRFFDAAQGFSMTATLLGLGTAVTGPIRDSDTDDLLRLLQPGEFTTFAMACGRPRLGQAGRHAASRAVTGDMRLDDFRIGIAGPSTTAH